MIPNEVISRDIAEICERRVERPAPWMCIETTPRDLRALGSGPIAMIPRECPDLLAAVYAASAEWCEALAAEEDAA